ncbi:hypothetical protein, partial [Pseudomonas putida]|uniref:hypothetical protein n=1 Tax=Pseudomonas putida TaxID=303 RepID=UPI001E30603C
QPFEYLAPGRRKNHCSERLEQQMPAATRSRGCWHPIDQMAVAEAECNTVIELKLEHHAA